MLFILLLVSIRTILCKTYYCHSDGSDLNGNDCSIDFLLRKPFTISSLSHIPETDSNPYIPVSTVTFESPGAIVLKSKSIHVTFPLSKPVLSLLLTPLSVLIMIGYHAVHIS